MVGGPADRPPERTAGKAPYRREPVPLTASSA